MSELKECLICGGEVDWCKNNLKLHDKGQECHYITCKTCGEFNLNFPDDLDWPEIYEYLADKWNNRTSTSNSKVQWLIDNNGEIHTKQGWKLISDLKKLIKPEGE